MTEKERDEISGTETTGHEWDGIKELNTPLPRWWLWTFYGTIVWALGYVIVYPAIPLINSATPGVLGYSSRAELDQQVAMAAEAQADTVARIEELDVASIIGDEELARFARAGGRSLFKNYCSQCHGSGATGAPGYPNLNDDEWIWGGTPEAIYATIAHGVRYEDDPETRFNLMPAVSEYLSPEEVREVSHYAASLSGMAEGEATAAGQQLFAENCAACHGEMGEGIAEMGAPALNNAIGLYAEDYEGILAQVQAPRHGVMPAWLGRMSEASVKQLAVYVHSLGGGQ